MFKYHNKTISLVRLCYQNLSIFNHISIFVIKVQKLNSMLAHFCTNNGFTLYSINYLFIIHINF